MLAPQSSDTQLIPLVPENKNERINNQTFIDRL